MTPIYSFAAAAAFALFAAGAASAAPISPAEAQKITAEVKAAEADWNAAGVARDPVKFASHYSEDATAMNPGAPVVKGRASIEAAMKMAFSDPNFNLTFAADYVGVSDAGDTAWTQGKCQVSETDATSHAKVTAPCAYLTIFRRDASGAWKAVEDIATPTPKS
jgi:uncharacterized protein (TIGR02246 family)